MSDDKTRLQDHSTVKQRSKVRTYRNRTDSSKSKTFSDHSILQSPAQWERIDEKELFQAGTIIRDNYRLEEQIGKGGMGVVWKAVDLIQVAGDSRDVYVAIKFLNKDFKQHPNALKALVREFAKYKRLIHPNIVKAYQLNRVCDIVFIVMEFIDGIPLDEFIKQHPNGIPLSQAEPIIRGMGEALAYAHEQDIAHLDFKPANVFYDQGVTKVIDFGIAQFIEVSDREKTRFKGSGAFTKAYASCERLAELEPAPCDDIYGLACVTYELLSGKHPFNKTRADKVKLTKEFFPPKPIKDLKNKQNKALRRALAFERKNRTPTVEKFLEQFFLSKPIGSSLAAASIFILLPLVIVMAFLVINLPSDKKIPEIENSPQRNALIHLVKVNELSTAFTSADKAKIESGLSKLSGANEAFRLEVLEKVEVREALISYYMDESSNEAFPKAFQMLDEALNLFSAYPKAQNVLTSHKAELKKLQEKAKEKRLKTLQAKYRQYLSAGKWLPDDSGDGIVDVLAQIKNIDPNYSLLKKAKLHQAFERKISQLVFAKGDTTLPIKDLFQAWRSLLHFSQRDKERLQRTLNFVWLFYRKKGFEAKKRGDKENAIKYFMYILELDWKKEVNRVMAKQVEDALAELM